jgi:alpha-beta hydrolase superfamily lysophospholipase
MSGVVRASRRILRYLILAIVAVVALASVGWGLMSRGLPELRPWHRLAPDSEFTAAQAGPSTTLSDYLAREAAVFKEVSHRVEHGFTPEPRDAVQRYAPGSPVNPSGFAVNWNRTFELTPASVVGGALLIHGMTDSPYSMRAVARRLSEAGYYCLAMRMPGHGTVPAGLARARWQDWAAAVRIGARHVRGTVGEGKPLVFVGYSNGGALVLNHALDALGDASLVRPDRLVLISPMIGVTAAAGLSNLISLLHGVPYFEKAAWTAVVPEYNPFKYTSFPAAAGQESFRLTRELDRKLGAAQSAGTLARLAPVLTFQSLVDATVAASAVLFRLYERLPANGSELVVFGLNRRTKAQAFMPPEVDEHFRRLIALTSRPYGLSVVSNVTDTTSEVAEWRIPAGATQAIVRSLGLSWPEGVFSLSHVAVPFPIDDPLYGLQPDTGENYGVRLGQLQARGERGVLILSGDDMLRLSSNPFFPFLDRRLRQWLSGEDEEAAGRTP